RYDSGRVEAGFFLPRSREDRPGYDVRTGPLFCWNDPAIEEVAMELGRVITAMATPFRADGSLDVAGAVVLAEHLADHGSDGIVVAGTTGEAPTLSHEEKRE